MNKHIALSLLIMSPSFVHAMENNTWSLSSFSWRSYIPAWISFSQVSNESKLVSDLQAIQTNLKNKLYVNTWTEQWVISQETSRDGRFTATTCILFPAIVIFANPTKFLQYCYYQKLHKKECDMTSDKIISTNLYKQCKEAQIDGYSALGIAMIAEDISIEGKRKFIQLLLTHDFKPTPKDIELEELILCNAITKQSKPMLHVLCSLANWSVLPQDIRNWIVQYMIQLFKK